MSAAPWITAQTRQLLARSGHAWLLRGPSGLGQYELALSLALAWLCERPAETGACGACPSCHAVEVRSHADLCLLMPETVMQVLGWPLDEKSQKEIDDKKRKPSHEIRIDAVRGAIEFSQRTDARGRGKVVMVYPAERMNTASANALLKTLEEPYGQVRYILATEAAHELPATVRSRCMTHDLVWPDEAQSLEWLMAWPMSAADASVLLRASGGRPADAAQMKDAGLGAAQWDALPAALARGDVAAVNGWSGARLVDLCQKLCHDLLRGFAGAAPLYFTPATLAPLQSKTSLPAVDRLAKRLTQAARTVDHPVNAGLFTEALVAQARQTLHSGS